MVLIYNRAKVRAVNIAQGCIRAVQRFNLAYELKQTRTRIALFVIGFQMFLYLIYYAVSGDDYSDMIFSTSSVSRFNPENIYLDLDTAPNLVKRYLKKFPQALEKPLYENCINFFKYTNNTEFYEILDSNFHAEQYGSNYYNDVLKQVQVHFENDGKDISKINDEIDVLPLMDKYTAENKKYEANLLDMITRLRVYGKCYLDNRVKSKMTDIETKLFPYLSGRLPVFENWKRQKVTFPYYKRTKAAPYSYTFVQDLQNRYNGRGIVMSIGENLVGETVQLLKVLRYLNNTLPIQLVHSNELTEVSVEKLFETARSDTIVGSKQELWIVDVSPCITGDYASRFRGFNSKWLAVLFNSFEEMVLMDNDAVPFVPPVKFFTDFANYNKTGTFFFRDRESFERVNQGTQVLIDKLLPTSIENLVFDVPVTKKQKLVQKYNFFEYGAKHFMESGVVVINKKKNLKGLLTSVNIQLIGGITHQFYGDKEIFWLGQVLAGNDNLYFNSNPAGNIGKIEEASKNSKFVKGIQPAHISPLDDHTLLWINSGLKICKKDTSVADFEDIYAKKEDARFSTAQDLKNYYESPIVFDGVVIPPNSNRDWNNDIHEPSRGFHQKDNEGCGGYYWFAYSSVGTPDDPPELTKGKVVTFTDAEREEFQGIANAWFS